MLPNVAEEITIQKQVIRRLCSTTLTHTKLRVLIKDVSPK